MRLTEVYFNNILNESDNQADHSKGIKINPSNIEMKKYIISIFIWSNYHMIYNSLLDKKYNLIFHPKYSIDYLIKIQNPLYFLN